MYFVFSEYVDFWFDNIHCYRTVDQQEGATHIEPPVIVVFTGTDKYEEVSIFSASNYFHLLGKQW